jgi:hypothetical protein
MQQLSDMGEWSNTCVLEWEKIDCLLDEARAAAKGRCSAKHTGLFPWSPALQTAGQTLLYWKLRKSGFTTRKVNATMLTNLVKSLKLTVADIA